MHCLCVRVAGQFPEEAAVPKVFPLDARKPAGSQALVGRRDFARNFDVFTEGLLKCTSLPWLSVSPCRDCGGLFFQ